LGEVQCSKRGSHTFLTRQVRNGEWNFKRVMRSQWEATMGEEGVTPLFDKWRTENEISPRDIRHLASRNPLQEISRSTNEYSLSGFWFPISNLHFPQWRLVVRNPKPLKNILPKDNQPYAAIASFPIIHFPSEEGAITPNVYVLVPYTQH